MLLRVFQLWSMSHLVTSGSVNLKKENQCAILIQYLFVSPPPEMLSFLYGGGPEVDMAEQPMKSQGFWHGANQLFQRCEI